MNTVDTTALDKAFGKDIQATPITTILEVENLVQCCEAQHGRLMSYLSAPARVEALLTYIFGRAILGDAIKEEEVPDANTTNKKALKEAKKRKKQEEKERKQFLKSLKKRTRRSVNEDDYADLLHEQYQGISLRVLTCGVAQLYSAFALPEEGERLFGVLFAVPLFDGTLPDGVVRDFLKIIQNLLNHRRSETLEYVRERPYLLSAMLMHVGASSMADVCVHFLQALDSSMVASWLADTQFLKLLVDQFLPHNGVVVYLHNPESDGDPGTSPKSANKEKRVASGSGKTGWKARLRQPSPSSSPPTGTPRLERIGSQPSLDLTGLNLDDDQDTKDYRMKRFPEKTTLATIVADFGLSTGKGALVDATPGRASNAQGNMVVGNHDTAIPLGYYHLLAEDEAVAEFKSFVPATEAAVAAASTCAQDVQESVARILVGMIDTLCHHQLDPGLYFVDGVLDRLLDGMLAAEDPRKSVVFLHGIAIVTRLVRHYKWTVQRPQVALKDAEGAWIGEAPTDEAMAVSEMGVSAQGLCAVVSRVYARLPQFQAMLAEGPAEPLQTTYGVPLAPPLGHARLKVVILFSMLVQMRAAVIDTELVRIGAVKAMADLFFSYPWNNFLHYYVSSTLLALLCSPSAEIVQKVLETTSIHEKILEAVALNKVASTDPKAKTGSLGYMGHVVVMANSMVNTLSHHPLLAEHQDWQTYVKGELAVVNAGQATKICGEAFQQPSAAAMAAAAEPDPPEKADEQPAATPGVMDYSKLGVKELNAAFAHAVAKNDMEAVAGTLDHGAAVDTADPMGGTPLMQAVTKNRFQLARLLVERGASVDVVNAAGYTPLHKAVATPRLLIKDESQRQAHIDLIRALIDRKCDVNKPNLKDQLPLASAARNGHHDAVCLILGSLASVAPQADRELPEVNRKDMMGTTPLYSAIQSNHGDIAAMLLHRGGGVGAKLPSVLRDQLRDEEGRVRLKVDHAPFFGIGAFLEIGSEALTADMLTPPGEPHAGWFIFTPEELRVAVRQGKPGFDPLMGGTLRHYRKAVEVALEQTQLERWASTPEARAGLAAKLTVAKDTLDEAIDQHAAAAMVATITLHATEVAPAAPVHDQPAESGDGHAAAPAPAEGNVSPRMADLTPPLALSAHARDVFLQQGVEEAELDDTSSLIYRLAVSFAKEQYSVKDVPAHLVQMYRAHESARRRERVESGRFEDVNVLEDGVPGV